MCMWWCISIYVCVYVRLFLYKRCLDFFSTYFFFPIHIFVVASLNFWHYLVRNWYTHIFYTEETCKFLCWKDLMAVIYGILYLSTNTHLCFNNILKWKMTRTSSYMRDKRTWKFVLQQKKNMWNFLILLS